MSDYTMQEVECIRDGYAAELATLRAENERLRMLIERAKIIIEDHNWVWHADAKEAMK